jgi:hypothetical protein
MILRNTLVLTLAALLLGADKPAATDTTKIVVDKEKKTITIPARVAPRKLAYLQHPGEPEIIYPIEVIACWSNDHTPVKGQKAHETVVNIDVNPSEVAKALEELGLKPGKPADPGQNIAAVGPEVSIYLELPGKDGGEPRKVPIEKTLLDIKTRKTMPKIKYLFTGSVMSKPSPDKDEVVYGADLTGSLITVFPVTDQVVIQTNLSMKDEPLLKLETDKKLLPPENTPVKLIMEVK